MRNLLKILIGIASLLLFTNMTCDENRTDIITVVNNSNDTIMAYLTFNYPDTFIPSQAKYGSPMSTLGVSRGGIEPNKSYTMNTPYEPREVLFAQHPIAQLFIIKTSNISLLSNAGGRYLNKRHLVLKRYEFTREDLEQMNWIVTYP